MRNTYIAAGKDKFEDIGSQFKFLNWL
jgi:hypothetical protein